jgi:hypothetical protein
VERGGAIHKISLDAGRERVYARGMNLMLEIGRGTLRGRPAKADVPFEIVGELTETDMARFGQAQEMARCPPGHLQTLKARHHTLARCLAEGMNESDAAMFAGYTPQTVVILKNDPTFQNLIKLYQRDANTAAELFREEMGRAGLGAWKELNRRIEEEPEELGTTILKELAVAASDRLGHGPSSTQVNVNVGLAARVEAGRKRVEAHRMKDVTPEVSKLPLRQEGEK